MARQNEESKRQARTGPFAGLRTLGWMGVGLAMPGQEVYPPDGAVDENPGDPRRHRPPHPGQLPGGSGGPGTAAPAAIPAQARRRARDGRHLPDPAEAGCGPGSSRLAGHLVGERRPPHRRRVGRRRAVREGVYVRRRDTSLAAQHPGGRAAVPRHALTTRASRSASRTAAPGGPATATTA